MGNWGFRLRSWWVGELINVEEGCLDLWMVNWVVRCDGIINYIFRVEGFFLAWKIAVIRLASTFRKIAFQRLACRFGLRYVMLIVHVFAFLAVSGF